MHLTIIQYVCVAIIPILFAITVHEVAHGWVACKLGDPTAKMLGRLTLNPIKHIDPVGTVLIPIVLLVLGGFIFGWAKPVPVDSRNFKNQTKDMAMVAIAGPLANFLMALLWALVLKLVLSFGVSSWLAEPVSDMAKVGIQINLILMILNILPIPPLDGSKVLMAFLPGPASYQLSRIEPYGFFIILALIASGILSVIITPIYHLLAAFIFSILGF